jgi:hypothetical protein
MTLKRVVFRPNTSGADLGQPTEIGGISGGISEIGAAMRVDETRSSAAMWRFQLGFWVLLVVREEMFYG